MGTYTDTYVEMLQEDLQHQYRRCFEVGTDLAQALQASEAKDKELAKEREKNTVLQLEVRRRLNLQMDTTAKVERRLVDALGVLSDRDIEVERLTFALKDKDEELAKECRKRSELQSDVIFKNQELKSFEDRIAELVHTLSCRDIEIERLTRKNKKPFKVAELRWLIDGHTDVLEEHRTAILEVREAVDQNKDTLCAAQREMLATLDRHDGLISKAFACIDNHSDSIYKQQQSIDALLSAIENQPKTKDDLWTYIRRQMNQQGVGGNNEEEEAR